MKFIKLMLIIVAFLGALKAMNKESKETFKGKEYFKPKLYCNVC